MEFDAAERLCSQDAHLTSTFNGMAEALHPSELDSFIPRNRSIAIDAAHQASAAFDGSSTFSTFADYYGQFKGSAFELVKAGISPFERIPFLRIDNFPLDDGTWAYLESNQQGQGFAAIPPSLYRDIYKAMLLSFSQMHGGLESVLVMPRKGDALLKESIDIARAARELGMQSTVRVHPPEKESVEGDTVVLDGERFQAAFVTGGEPPSIPHVFPEPAANMIMDNKIVQRIILERYTEEEGLPLLQTEFHAAFNYGELVDALDRIEGLVTVKNFLYGSGKGVYFVRDVNDLESYGIAFLLAQFNKFSSRFAKDYVVYPVCVEKAMVSKKYEFQGSLRIHDGTVFTPGVAMAAMCRVAQQDYDPKFMEHLDEYLATIPKATFSSLKDVHDKLIATDGRLLMDVDEALKEFANEFAKASEIADRVNTIVRNQYLVSAGYHDANGVMQVDGERIFLIGSDKARRNAQVAQELEGEYATNLLLQSNLVMACLDMGARELKVPDVMTPASIRQSLVDSRFGNYFDMVPDA